MTGVRSYVAGSGASGSLLLAALVAFLSVTAFVAFEGVPIGAGDNGAETVSIEGPDFSPATAAAAAAATAGPPPAVAAVPAAPTPAALAAAAGGAPGGGGTGGAGGPGAGTPGAPGGDLVPGLGPGTQTEIAVPAPTVERTNPVDDVVAGLDQTVQGATGLDPNLGGATRPVTGALDQTLQDLTGNDLGGHLDNLGLRPGGRVAGDLGPVP